MTVGDISKNPTKNMKINVYFVPGADAGGVVGRDSFDFIEQSMMSISCFRQILLSYSRFSRVDKTDFKDFPTRIFSDIVIFEIMRFPKIMCFEKELAFVLYSLK